MHLLTQTPLRADAKAVAYDQHPNQQLRIDRRPASVTVERHEVPTQLGQIEETINAAQQMIRRHVIVEIEGIEQLLLRAACSTHHRIRPLESVRAAYRYQGSFCTSFSTQ